MPSERTIRRQITNRHLTSGIPYDDGKPREPTTYHQIGIVEATPSPGRFAGEDKSKVIGAGAEYPKASEPFSSPTVHALNRAQDHFVSAGIRPVEERKLATPVVAEEPPFDYASATDAQLERRKAFACLAQKQAVDGPVVDRAQAIIDAIDDELNRRRSAGRG